MSIDTAGLTPQQAKLLRFIAAHLEEHGFSPSYAEMAVAMGLASKSGIHRMIGGLEALGRVIKVRRGARSISLVRPPDVSIFVGRGGAIRVDVAGHVTPDWLRRHGDHIEVALNARLAGIVGRAKIGRAA